MATIEELREREAELEPRAAERRRTLSELESAIRHVETLNKKLKTRIDLASSRTPARPPRRRSNSFDSALAYGTFMVPLLGGLGVLSGFLASAFVIIPLMAADIHSIDMFFPAVPLALVFGGVGVVRGMIAAREDL